MNDRNTILVLDLDGTIIKTGEPLDEELAYFLKKYVGRRSILITTARHPLGVKFVLEDKLGFVPTISLNGAGLHLTSWSKFDRVIYFHRETVDKINTKLLDYDLTIAYYGKGFWAVSNMSHYVEKESIVTGMTPSPWKDYYARECIKILVMCDPSILKMVRERINKTLSNQVQLSTSHETYLEISPPSVSKDTFIPNFLELSYHENKEQPYIIFIGDSENDLSCAKFADEAWTFPSSSMKLKDVCTGILTHDNGLGLKEFLCNLNKQKGGNLYE